MQLYAKTTPYATRSLILDEKGRKYILEIQKIQKDLFMIKFIYSEKAAKFCEIFPLLMTTVHTVKSKGMISQNFVAFSEYMNFTYDRKPFQSCLLSNPSRITSAL